MHEVSWSLFLHQYAPLVVKLSSVLSYTILIGIRTWLSYFPKNDYIVCFSS
jgi:hypothetical protein